ncbi:MAG: family 20 glycosylhydrolase [bacterium]
MSSTNKFEVRGFHLDLRIQVMTPKALQALADDLVALGINTLVMEWEGTFPFVKHPQISSRFAYTPGEVNDFLAHCRRIGLDVMPLQQCFGHVEYILRHPRYAHLREVPHKDYCQLCPLKVEEALPLFKDLFAELARVHPSPYFHIGCDETYLLGNCPKCHAKTEAHGKSKLFVDYVKALCSVVTALGKRPVLWADMLLAHPEAAKGLPADCILVDWNYGWANDRFGNPSTLLDTGLTFWGSPALRSHPDDFHHVAFAKHFKNIEKFLPYCREKGFSGSVLTSWSTSGQYGYEFGTGYEVIDMYPIRNVYPLNGTRILLAAFATAVNSARPMDVDSFVQCYAEERFGLTGRATARFQQALLSDDFTVGVGDDPAKAQRVALANVRLWEKLEPRRNKQEFAHFRLLSAIRLHYLAVRKLEIRFQSPAFRPSQLGALARECEALSRPADELDRQFTRLMRGFLHPAEIQMENSVRRLRLKVLAERAGRVRG